LEGALATRIDAVDREVERQVEALGYEFVDLEWGGSDARPILRLRVDRPDSSPGNGVTLDDCVRVSRAVEPWLDEFRGLPERYTLEVSSPGVERPLLRRRDFERFQGARVAVQLRAQIPEVPGGLRFEGVLVGVEGAPEGEEYGVCFRLDKGTEFVVPAAQLFRARTVYRWDEEE
jgi:ribosome maturation factor RimP